MDDKKIQSALQDALETEIPSTSVHLWPRVRIGFAAGNNQQGKKMNTTLRRITFTALAIAILLAIVLITPQGRALAQRVIQFFNVTEEKTYPVPTDQILPAPPTPTARPAQILPVEPALPAHNIPTAVPDTTCNSSSASNTYFCQVKAVEAQAGFNAKEFANDPKGTKFSTAAFLPSTNEIDMQFVVTTGGGYLNLRQGTADFPEQKNTGGKVPSDAVEQVSVNGLYAEMVSGGFMVYPDATTAVWEPGGQISLAWRDGKHWFVLEKIGDPYPIEWITKDPLIQLAEGLVDERPADAVAPLDPENLSTVEQARTLAGFDIPTPTMLPAGYELKRIAWANNVVHLMYGPKDSSQNELFIFLGQIANNNQVGPCSDCPSGVTEMVKVGPWQGWYWRGIFHSAGSAVSGQPTPTPIWEGDAPQWNLVWNSDRFWFSMFYSPAYRSGKEANQQMLIKIAESIK